MSVLTEVLKANAGYAATFGAKSKLTIPPARHFTILTCMDARLDPAKYAGLAEGDAHVIRNAGGRASDDALRSLVISYKLLGTNEFFVIHHTDCGMLPEFKWSSQHYRCEPIVEPRRAPRPVFASQESC
jgi:carbonic anhydrase